MCFNTEMAGLLHGDLGFPDGSTSSDYRFSDSTVDLAFRGSLAASFHKKLEPIGVNREADKRALELFLESNASLPHDDYEFTSNSEAESVFWDYFRSNMNKTLGDTVGSDVFLKADPSQDEPSERQDFQSIDLDFIRRHLNVGPGASQKANADTMVTKLFEGTISHYGSEYLIALYRAALVDTGWWCDAERLRNRKFGFTKVRGGNIFFAKKNADISRVCCTEALLESLFQKVCCAFAELRLEACFGINLSKQPFYNQQMAKQGSIDGSIGTIDLKSASDMQGLHMINKALDHCSFKTMINLCRSDSVILPDGSVVKLNMISTMGNGFTFPLQTIVFACVVRSVYAMMEIPSFDCTTQFGVFGDDICVSRRAYDFTCRMLTKLGFTVNYEKSYNNGPFRESCGADYFSGVNIRGVYVKSMRSPQEICSVLNRLNRWSARSGVDLPLTVSALRAMVPMAPLVPISEDDLAGIHVPFFGTIPKLDNSYWFLYRKWRVKSRKVKVLEPDQSINPYGVASGFLSGHIRRSDRDYGDFWGSDKEPPGIYVSLRDVARRELRHKIVGSSIPYWDWCPPRVGLGTDEYKRWSVLVLSQQ